MKWTSYLLLIYFLAINLLPKADICELAKIPALFEHFHADAQQQANLGIIDFLIQHYSISTPNEKDTHQSEDLPFQGHDCDFCANCSFCLMEFTPLSTVESCELNVPQSLYLPNFSPNYCAHIWQPPQV